MRPAAVGLLIQAASVVLATLLYWQFGISSAVWLVCQSSFSVAGAVFLRQPKWWLFIHLLFMPAVVFALSQSIPPGLYLLAFVVAWLVFGRIDKTRVPLYLSNQLAIDALIANIPADAAVLDIGSGLGTVILKLAAVPGLRVTGIEYACLPWLISVVRLRLLRSSARVLRGDVADLSLREFDVVYAFLSPAFMPTLWEKAKREMRSGSYLISNTFSIPDVEADEVIELNDWKGARLYLWRMP